MGVGNVEQSAARRPNQRLADFGFTEELAKLLRAHALKIFEGKRG
jgi:hypothetical protein